MSQLAACFLPTNASRVIQCLPKRKQEVQLSSAQSTLTFGRADNHMTYEGLRILTVTQIKPGTSFA